MTKRYTDGRCRRDFLRAGALSGMGLSLSGYLRRASVGGVVDGAKAKAGILIYLNGGPSHMDTFDLKPQAPDTMRGEFQPIATNVPGIEICEHLPQLAQCADKYVIVRGVSHALAAHEFGKAYLTTGNAPLASLTFPGYGSVVTKELPSEPDLPGYVAIPNTPEESGYLGVQQSAFSTSTTPVPGKPFAVRGIALDGSITTDDVTKRRKLLDKLDSAFRGYEQDDDLLRGLDRFSHQAHDIIRSPRSRHAFDVSLEKAAVAKPFGEHAFGQSCLLATRLIESGVRFVTVNFSGWDTHQNNFSILKEQKLPQLDQGLAALFNTLAEKGLLESTSIMVTGEFGRTPKINPNAGRDHWPRNMFVVLAGGGFQGGQVIGESNVNGETPTQGDGFSPDDIAASFYHNLGIDPSKEYHEATGRPIMIVRHGSIIPQLFTS